MKNQLTNDNLKTRIIPGLSSQYQIVSLPYWAWFWLDDFMQHHRISYKGIYDTFITEGDVNQTLHHLAELHQEYSMRERHNLANDNEFENSDYVRRLNHKTSATGTTRELNLPKIYKLFGFMSCATTLDAVWKRRNYEDSNKVN